jgi:hypothetical protein
MKWYSTKHGLGDIIGPIRVQYILAMSSEPERLVIRAAAYVVVATANAHGSFTAAVFVNLACCVQLKPNTQSDLTNCILVSEFR